MAGFGTFPVVSLCCRKDEEIQSKLLICRLYLAVIFFA